MAELSIKELEEHLHAHLFCLELCIALGKATDDPDVREALGALIETLQASLSTLSRRVRHQGGVPGAYELKGGDKARIREAAANPSLLEQLLAVRRSLADLVALYAAHQPAPYAAHQPAPQEGLTETDWLLSLSTQAYRLLADWDQHMVEMKAQ
jgi:hypothetical protein